MIYLFLISIINKLLVDYMDSDEHKQIKKTKKIDKPEKKDKTEKTEKKGKTDKTNKIQKINNTQIIQKEETVRKGRPKQGDKIQIAEDPTSNIQQKILNYLSTIGLKHGLVFRKEDREKLRKQNSKKQPHEPKIQWREDHDWKKTEEQKKIINHEVIYRTLYEYQKNNKSLTNNDLVQMFLNIGDISADQCTLEIYETLALALRFTGNPRPSDSIMEEQLNTFYNKLKFLNGQFTKLKIQYWIEIKLGKEEIRGYFINMVKQLRDELEKVLKDPKKLKNFITEQIQMDEKLQEIIRNEKAKKK